MNQIQREHWIDEVLTEVLAAVMQADELREALIFKGAWILNLHLRDPRHSQDIDAIMPNEWVTTIPQLDRQAQFFGDILPRTVRRHFEKQSPVRFQLTDATVERNPPRGHPMGWDMHRVILHVRDNSLAGVHALPRVEIEISAPEKFGPNAIEEQQFLGSPARVYSLHRIAGEKLRAYLTSLPAYRKKVRSKLREFRVKDLYDLARIVRAKPASDLEFWQRASQEFILACESRDVDCLGPDSFKQNWSDARARYNADAHLTGVPFSEAEAALDSVLAVFLAAKVFPIQFLHLPLGTLNQ